jgi:hypothetical protein
MALAVRRWTPAKSSGMLELSAFPGACFSGASMALLSFPEGAAHLRWASTSFAERRGVPYGAGDAPDVGKSAPAHARKPQGSFAIEILTYRPGVGRT